MTVYVNDPDFELRCGDVLEQLAELPDNSVDCVITSPPYWGLRDYGTGSWEGGDPDCDHKAAPGAERKFTNGRGEGTGDDYAGSNLRSWTTRDGTAYRDVCGKCGARRTDRQLGLEATPEEYVTRMVEVFREVRRVLAPHGTCWVNIGDSYAQGHGGSSTEGQYVMRKAARGEASNPQRGSLHGRQCPCSACLREDWALVEAGLPAGGHGHLCSFCGWRAPTYTALVEHHKNSSGHKPGDGNYQRKGGLRNVVPNMKPKDLCGIPWRLAFALQADGWWLRSEIIWAKPNPMPESVTDRPTKAHENIFLLTKAPRYFYDADAVREPHSPDGRQVTTRTVSNGSHGNYQAFGHEEGRERWANPAGRNLRSVWDIATEPYPDAHFATYPQKLVERCLLAGCPSEVCDSCGFVLGTSYNAGYEYQDDYLRGVRQDSGVHASGSGSPLLLQDLCESADGPDSRDNEGLRDERQGVPASMDAATPAGIEGGLHHGAPLLDGTAFRAGAPQGRDRPPPQRGEGRQPDREPASHAHADAQPDAEASEEADRLPTLRRRDHHVGTCPSCGSRTRPGRVLDPFLGSGTTAAVARKHGRRTIGIELNDSYCQLAAKRLAQLSLLAEPA